MKRSRPAARRQKTIDMQPARDECRRAVYERDRTCQAERRVFDVDCSYFLHVHEILPRARGGSTTDPANCLLLCDAHHAWVHRNPREATRLGLLRSAHP